MDEFEALFDMVDEVVENGNEEGEGLILGAVDALVQQTGSIERVVAVLGHAQHVQTITQLMREVEVEVDT